MLDIGIISIKRILFNKTIRIILFCILVVSIYLTFVMATNSQIKSSIPIGVLNMDESKDGRELLNQIKQIPAFYIYQDTRENLDTLLKEDKIQAIFIIKEGYSKFIKAGKVNGLVTLLYKENNNAVKILSDIFAGEMLKNICMYKSFLLYDSSVLNYKNQIKNNNYSYDTLEIFSGYVMELESRGNSFVFDIKAINTGQNSDISGNLDNSLLYMQVVSGILTMLISLLGLYIALPQVMDIESGIRTRIGLGGGKRSRFFLLDLCTMGAGLCILLCFQLIICLCFYFSIPNFTLIHTVWLFLLFLLFSFVIIPVYMIIANLVGKVRVYEGIGIVAALIFGILGIGSMFTGFINNDLLNISKLVPNSWFIDAFIDIIVNTGLQDIPYMHFFRLGITGCGLICILWLLDKVKPI